MVETHTVTFQSNIALDEWRRRNAGRIQIMSISSAEIIVGYNVSRSLINPNINFIYYFNF
jgi:hypothetical protein